MRTLIKTHSIWPGTAALAVTVASFMMPAFSAHCQAPDTLLITENSDISLSVTWNGSSITPTLMGNDHWTFNLPVAIYLGGERAFGSPNGASIPEPGGSSTTGPWNNVYDTSTQSAPFTTLVDVQSDVSTTTGFASVILNDTSGLAGVDLNGSNVDLTFNDLGDSTRTVPDNASTVMLALVSVIMVFGAARFQMAKAG